VAYHLGQLELVFLCVLLLCLAMLDTPIPRVLALPAAALVVVQTAALHALEVRPVSFADDPHPGGLSGVAGALAAVVVPALGVALLVVALGYLARANAELRHRQRHADGLGRSGLGGRLHDGQLDRR